MERQLSGRARAAARAALTNATSPQLLRAQAAFGAAWAAEWTFTVALSVFAYREGGAVAVGLVALLRMLPSAALAPFIGVFADRFRRERVLIVSSAVRAAAVAAMAGALVTGAPAWIVYGFAVLATIAMTPYRAAHSALLPSLCRTTEELTASNAVRGLLDSVSVLVGPLAAAALLEWTSVEAAFAAVALTAAASGAVLAGLRYEQPPRPPAASARILADAVAGARAVAANRDVALIFALGGVQTFVRGALTVFTVVIAIDLLGTGEAGVGVLTAAMGAGAIVGSIATGVALGSRGLARAFGVSVALWGAPLVAIAAAPEHAVALAALAVIGVGNAILDVAAFTLIPRLADDAVLARVFAVLEATVAVAVGLGSVLAPLAVEALGIRGALAVVGTLAPAAAALAWWRLRQLDAAMSERDAEIGLLRGVSLLRPLPLPTIEHLARHVESVRFNPGEPICRQGDVGDRFYVIADGDADVLDGTGIVARLHAGEGFGEIALLRDVARTRTVLARTPLSAYAIRRADFTPAVSGYSSAAAAATILMDRRLNAASVEADAEAQRLADGLLDDRRRPAEGA